MFTKEGPGKKNLAFHRVIPFEMVSLIEPSGASLVYVENHVRVAGSEEH